MSYLNSPLLRVALYVLVLVALGLTLAQSRLVAQAPEPAGTASTSPTTPEPQGVSAAAAPNPSAAQPTSKLGMSFWDLYWQGGFFMHPILALLFLGVTFIIERGIGLRRTRVVPQELVVALGQMVEGKGGFDPRQAYRICQQFPSAAANVVRGMLLKVGRPLSEVEHAALAASNTEATKLYANVRWLNLCSSVAPLFGLIGTIQGMILAFHKMTQLEAGANKANELASGIYTALITTFGGLMVAIPTSMAAHYFEGRLQKLFHEIDDLAASLLPMVERYEGRVRFGRQSTDAEPARAPADSGTPVA